LRKAFISAIEEAAEKDDRVFLLTADLGYTVFEEFYRRFPKRFLNVGVAEANMVSLAAGLASTGYKVFAYSIATFASMRGFEQFRNGACLHHLPVIIVGAGGGYAYGHAGPTHHALEDIALMRALPGAKVVCPADPAETRAATLALLEEPGPAYLRIGKVGEPNVHDPPLQGKFHPGRAFELIGGEDVTLFSTGSITSLAREAAEYARERGIGVRLISMPWIKPMDRDFVLDAARSQRGDTIFTLEEHQLNGGLGSAIAEILAEENPGVRLHRFGVRDHFAEGVGDAHALRARAGLSVESLCRAFEKVKSRKPVSF